MGMTPGRVVVRVDRLVVTGFAPGQGEQIAAALEAELSRLLREDGAPESLAQGGARASAPAQPIRAAHDAPADQVGGAVAGSIYGALGK